MFGHAAMQLALTFSTASSEATVDKRERRTHAFTGRDSFTGTGQAGRVQDEHAK